MSLQRQASTVCQLFSSSCPPHNTHIFLTLISQVWFSKTTLNVAGEGEVSTAVTAPTIYISC